MLGGLHGLAGRWVGGRENKSAVHGKRQRRREEQRHGDHMGGIVMKMQILVTDVRDPVEVADDAIGKGVAPGTQKEGPDDLQRHIGKYRKAEGDRNMKTDAELAAYFDFAQCPADEGPGGAEGDDLPEAAFAHRCDGQSVFEIRRRDIDLPQVPRRSDRRSIDDQRRSDRGEKHRQYTEETHIEGAHPEVEQVAADEGSATDPVFSFETQHCHRGFSVPATAGITSIVGVRGRNMRSGIFRPQSSA